jgi:Tfp pilus assembly protein PilZ
MSTYKARREPRVNVALDVTLQTLRGEEPFRTRNASSAGVFVVCPDPFPLRKLVRFRTRLPDTGEELQMMGLVAHTINRADAAEGGRPPGMGIQIFSLGEENGRKWREFIGREYDKDEQAQARAGQRQRPSVRVRIPNRQLLEKFYGQDLPSGGIFLRTAELHPQGAEVHVDIVHPETGKVFTLDGKVEEVVPAPVRDRGMQLSLTPPEDMTLLRQFMDDVEAT